LESEQLTVNARFIRVLQLSTVPNIVTPENCKLWVGVYQAILTQIATYPNDDNNLNDMILVSPENNYQKDRL